MAEIAVFSDENVEKAIKRFKKMVDREGILLEVKKRRYYAKPASQKHEKLKKMERKRRKKIMKTKKLY
ncbi:MAG: 30S ribosomal protein S21 [Spirochaetes bacterium GWD1_27_9]|nr:MAG: 30S ribosomal protein S21 [Spirochaetes bacterium GWB1_27_13]OHD22476.1 MAG: 30S ribosomal protein S21 [Spirochaetes bacterium GWC1_27_15]OHD42825.1 MAG: 30S ribosomal protein S21 [Spirochaetes bacterium GWD1_27_9]